MVAESKSLPERVAGIYYSHGVLCAAHPIPVIIIAIITVLLTCIPLVNLPLPSNIPQIYVEPVNGSLLEQPRWLSDPPIYLQQVIMKSAVSPWTKEMILSDAIRGPLAEVFRLIEAVQNYQHPSGITLADVCTHVEAPVRPFPLPQYNCLVVSPANFWHQDPSQFFTDVSLVSTVYSHMSIQVGKSTLPELLFGMSLKESGFKRYPLRNRQRVLQYAITIFYNKYNKEFIDGMTKHLVNLYPLHQANSTNSKSEETVHIYHPGDFDFHEFMPLFFTYTVLFFYMYFSVRKIELVKNKVGIALSAVFTVMASLVMSIGLCFLFGLDPAGSSRGREVFPYLVVVVGLENILVLTKSVVSTQAHLDAKIRVAQGLSKEGWGITKNLLAELTILTVGLFTLVPSIQEFCIFAMVGLLCDFFLQMCFFSTVLSLDMRGMEEASDGMMPRLRDYATPQQHRVITRTRSVPRLDCHAEDNDKVPKRLRLVLFWGRTRIVQRAFMLVMIVWIGGFLYSAGIVHHLVPSSPEGEVKGFPPGHIIGRYQSLLGKEGEAAILGRSNSKHQFTSENKTGDDQILLSCGDARPLQLVKWCYLSNVYNSSSTTVCRLTALPPIRLGCLIPPSRAVALRNPLEPPEKPFKWHSLAQALDPTEGEIEIGAQVRGWETPFLPTSPLEVLLVTALCVISILFMAYTALALYHCVCSRNYAQWRSAWSNSPSSQPDTTAQVVLQAVPLVLEGQGQCVEWLTSDGSTVSCSYLSGDVNVWDASSGERLAHIDRKNYFSAKSDPENCSTEDNSPTGEYESNSPPPTYESTGRDKTRRRFNIGDQDIHIKKLPDLSKAINFKFTKGSAERRAPQDYSNQGYDYGPTVRLLYAEENDAEWEEETEEGLYENCPQIWCISSSDNLIVLGTSSGRLEFWEATSGKLKGIFEDNCNIGVTCIKMVAQRCIVARLNGGLEVFTIDWSFYGPNQTYRRAGGHCRTQSSGGLEGYVFDGTSSTTELVINRGRSVRAHQQPITVLEVEAGRILTGSRDHTLKVFSLVDELLVFTLHGHCGPITALFIDSVNPLTAGSGSHDGMVCVWDLLTGACVYSLEAHDGPVTAMTYSSSYVLSLGFDEKLCVWDRFQGHLLNTVHLAQAYCTSMAMLTHNLLITSKQGSLVIWDVRTGEPVRLVKLGHADPCVFVTTILPLRDSVACDYGHSLRIVRFPLVRDKTD